MTALDFFWVNFAKTLIWMDIQTFTISKEIPNLMRSLIENLSKTTKERE
jgi:hypothetical protein